MFSKILVKLIDQAIVPAVLLVTVRMVSMFLVASYFNIPFRLTRSGLQFSTSEDFLKINSYSILGMIVAVSVGVLYILIKSYLFHDSHISPNMTAKLFSLKLSSFIQNSYELYSQASIWVSYMYLIMITSGVMALFNMLYPWVFYSALVLTVVTTIGLIVDVENELELNSKNSDVLVEEDYILEMRG